MKAALAIAAIFMTTTAAAHTQWVNGDAVPAWVKKSCCGPADAHPLDPSQVVEDGNGYVVTTGTLTLHVRRDHALPSQDGQYWIFYPPEEKHPYIYCFFVPMGS